MRLVQARTGPCPPMDVWQGAAAAEAEGPHLVLVHADRADLAEAVQEQVRRHPAAVVAGCSGAGQILGDTVSDGVAVTALRFKDAHVQATSALVGDRPSDTIGADLVAALPSEGLRHVLLLSDGLQVNGTDLARGAQARLPAGVAVTGGLAGDGDRFGETLVALGDEVRSGQAVAIGFYGAGLRIGFGSLGGWDPFGPRRQITKAQGNVLYELDERPALDLYKQFLGEHASGLPATGLLFPLHLDDGEDGLVRTILAVDEDAKSLTFAGDVPEGARAQLMKANFDRLVDGASGAAERSSIDGAEFAFLVSCVGRRLVLKQRTEDELDAVHDVLGRQAAMAGFYSYGEICPAAPGADCQLHNQTMTITTFSEA